MPEQQLPQPGTEAAERHVPADDKLTQHLLALGLRYSIDKASVEAVRLLFDENPWGVRSRHVAHNLGKTRMQWLREKGFIHG